MTTIEEAREFLFHPDNFSNGNPCPACDQLVKQYRRPMHHSMVRMLINLYWLDRMHPDYYHLLDIIANLKLTGTTDFAILAYWGFIEKKPLEKDNKKTRTSGFWKITPAGKLFVENKTMAFSHALIYNSSCYGLAGNMVGVKDVLRNFFNYEELMENA